MKNPACCLVALSLAFASLAVSSNNAAAQKKYDPGASDTEIKIGNMSPYSGPASAGSVMGKTEEAYFKKINDEGGINGRKITFISYDDAYSPPKTVEQSRKLVEGDEVLLIFATVGTATNAAIQKYMNQKKVPLLFLNSGAIRFGDPKESPWTMGWIPSYRGEGQIYAKYLLKEKPNAKIGLFYQNDDYGKEYVRGLKEVFGDKASSLIVAEETYEPSEPTIDAHILKLKSANVDVVIDISLPKFAAQAIKKMAELGWKPMHILGSPAASIGATIKPAGFEESQGLISAAFLKDPDDPQFKDDPGVKEWLAFLDKYYPGGDRRNALVALSYSYAQTLVEVLKQCGDDLSRENVMKQAANLKNLRLGMLLPGITVNTSPTDFSPVEQMQLMKLKGERLELFGDIISFESSK